MKIAEKVMADLTALTEEFGLEFQIADPGAPVTVEQHTINNLFFALLEARSALGDVEPKPLREISAICDECGGQWFWPLENGYELRLSSCHEHSDPPETLDYETVLESAFADWEADEKAEQGLEPMDYAWTSGSRGELLASWIERYGVPSIRSAVANTKGAMNPKPLSSRAMDAAKSPWGSSERDLSLQDDVWDVDVVKGDAR